MSKIGQKPIAIPDGVSVKKDGQVITISGAKGELRQELPPVLKVDIASGILKIVPKNETRQARALWGTWRSLLANAVKGVTEGWQEVLQVVGTGYKINQEGNAAVFQVGLSHLVRIDPPEGVQFRVDGDLLFISGADRQAVGEIAAQIRRVRPPDPYKGKGIRYQKETIKLKPGKIAKTAA